MEQNKNNEGQTWRRRKDGKHTWTNIASTIRKKLEKEHILNLKENDMLVKMQLNY